MISTADEHSWTWLRGDGVLQSQTRPFGASGDLLAASQGIVLAREAPGWVRAAFTATS